MARRSPKAANASQPEQGPHCESAGETAGTSAHCVARQVAAGIEHRDSSNVARRAANARNHERGDANRVGVRRPVREGGVWRLVSYLGEF